MRVLLHSCCAPCAIKCVETLRAEGIEPSILWLNPNIHPYTEYISRRDSLLKFCNEEKLNLIYSGEYGLRSFLNGLGNSFSSSRCEYCYNLRLDAAVREAKLNGFDAFSTTLLISPYQKHDLIREIGEQKAKNTAFSFCTGISALTSAMGRTPPVPAECICKNIAVAFSARKSASPARPTEINIINSPLLHIFGCLLKLKSSRRGFL